MWLNGEPVREHAGFPGDAHGEGGGAGMGGGYTSFSVRLDNATSVQYGANKNVLAVYVDPRMGSGWFYEVGGSRYENSVKSRLAVDMVLCEPNSMLS
jgi:hypothetical protein